MYFRKDIYTLERRSLIIYIEPKGLRSEYKRDELESYYPFGDAKGFLGVLYKPLLCMKIDFKLI